MKIVILTVGTRGDVQPFVALGQALLRAGHEVTIATHAAFAPLIEAHGLRQAFINDDLVQLTNSDQGRAMMESGSGLVNDAKRALAATGQFASIYRRMLVEEWESAQGAELLIYHPQAVGGYHIAEALGIPGIMADLLPTFVPTSAFPSVTFPELPLGGVYNRLTYAVLPAMLWGMFGKVVREWRESTLRIAPTPVHKDGLTRKDGRRVPVMLGFSPEIVPPPSDWPPTVMATGYWFLDHPDAWHPPDDLVAFLASGPPPVYVGFGSMAGRNPERAAKLVREALAASGARGIVASGWGGLTAATDSERVFYLREAPHDWLFPQMAAVVHHGGAGTTASGLRAGKPTIVCPFVADQPMWGRRLARLGVGPAPIPQKALTAEKLADAIRRVLADDDMRDRAADLGARIREEKGLENAVRFIEAHGETFARI
jgi:sterol 3beta-glucosyltransferase